ncbi:hypothetical protein B0H10DRAFT_1685813, partial [Mycena sp. CBHHK59/15]
DFQESEDKKKNPSHARYPFAPSHPQYRTHYVCIYPENLTSVVPNFVGGSLPRRDAADREYYSCTMLTLFKPWRSGTDLKTSAMDWDTAFITFSFTPRQMKLMDNFNLRYECNDARDDHYAQLKKKTTEARK